MNIAKKLLITGGTAGIGKALVEHFDQLEDYEVYYTARSETKAQALQQNLKNSKYFIMDFSNFETVVSGTEEIRKRLPKLDILINNAGTWQMEFRKTQDAIEMNFAVNHLAPMLLTLELLPVLKAADAGRIINTSSGAHRRDILDFDDIEFRHRSYDGVATYSQSKLCNLLFTHGLNSRLGETNVTVNTVHPGYVQSDLFQNMGTRNWETVPSAEHGARSAIYAATSTALEGVSGKYFYLESEEERLSALATNDDLAQTLWDLSMTYLKSHLTQTL